MNCAEFKVILCIFYFYIIVQVGDEWKEGDVTWTEFLDLRSTKTANILFASLDDLHATNTSVRQRVFEKLQMPGFLQSRPYTELNSFCGRHISVSKTDGSQDCGSWCRFIIKQTGRSLRTKPSFVRHDVCSTPKTISTIVKNLGALHGPSTLEYGWEWYEMTFAIKIRSALTELAADKRILLLQDPHAALAVILHQLIPAYDRSVWAIRDHVCSLETARQMEPDYTILHEVSRHATHVSETLEVATKSFKALLDQRDNLISYSPETSPTTRNETSDLLKLAAQVTENLLSRSESNKARIQNEISLAYHLASQRDSKVQLEIAERMQQDSVIMKNLAFVAVAFLPASLICGIFGMQFFSFNASENDGRFVVSDKFWIFFVTAFPLSAITIAIWWQYNKKLSKPAK